MSQPVGQGAPNVPAAELFAMYLRLGLATFGGGLSAWMHREMVVRRRWLDEQTFLTGLTISQILPGGNAVNLAIYVGLYLRGSLGAALAIVGMMLPPFLLIVLLGALYDRYGAALGPRAVLGGIACVGAAMTFATAIRSGRRLWLDWPMAAVALATFLAIGVARLPLLPVIGVLAPVSIGIALLRATREGRPGGA